jgi:tRNA threonylcarbamoyladenosine biosynthesis protein TsaE
MEKRILYHLEDLEGNMEQVFSALDGRKKIALYGEMAAGKTTFTAAFCRFLGAEQPAASPTFSLINQYHYTDSTGKEVLIHHLDLYRLKNIEEALDIGIEDILHDSHYCIIEWPQTIEKLLPDFTAKIMLHYVNDFQRQLIIL